MFSLFCSQLSQCFESSCPKVSSCSHFAASCVMYTRKMGGWVRGFLVSTRKEVRDITRKWLLWRKAHIYCKNQPDITGLAVSRSKLVDFKTSCFNAHEVQVPICTPLALPASHCLFYSTGCRLRATWSCQMQEDVSCSPVPAAAKNIALLQNCKERVIKLSCL